MKLAIAVAVLTLIIAIIPTTYGCKPFCPEKCDVTKCEKLPEKCHCGVVKDVCGCCDVCARCGNSGCIVGHSVCEEGYYCGFYGEAMFACIGKCYKNKDRS